MTRRPSLGGCWGASRPKITELTVARVGQLFSTPTVAVTEGDSYGVALGPRVVFDAIKFLDLVDSAASEADPERQRSGLEAAFVLYGGGPYPKWPYEPWAEGLQAWVWRARMRALDALGQNLVEHGDAADAVEPLSALLELDAAHAVDLVTAVAPDSDTRCRARRRA
jgi:hypothetical protein